jgi:hypothetical protein
MTRAVGATLLQVGTAEHGKAQPLTIRPAACGQAENRDEPHLRKVKPVVASYRRR